MGATTCTLRWSVTVEAYEHWTKEHLAQCEQDDPSSYDEWVIDQLGKVMADAGDAFIKANPDLFRSDSIV